MRVRLDFEYLGIEDKPDTEYPGSFVKAIDEPPWTRMPTIGESITIRGHWVVRVTWVLWPLSPEDDVVLSVETQPGYAAFVPNREGLRMIGWREA